MSACVSQVMATATLLFTGHFQASEPRQAKAVQGWLLYSTWRVQSERATE